MKNKAAVLLFGAFNPFTNAHLLLGRLASEAFPGYEILYIPARLAYFQVWKNAEEKDVLPEQLRLDLLKAGIAGEPGFSVCDVELKGMVNGRTWNTLQYFRAVLGYTDLVLCFGTDKVAELETWYMGRELVEENHFLIVTRSGNRLADCMTPFTLQHADHFTELCNDALADLSATAVREALHRGDKDFVFASVPPACAELLLQAAAEPEE